MSLLMWPISKLPLSKKPFSSHFSTTATTSRSKPYLLLDALNFKLYDPTTNKEFVTNLKIQNQSQTFRNLKEPIGSSRGYLAIKNLKDSSVDLVEIFDDSQLKKPKIISLPPLHFENFENSESSIENVSVSSPVNNGGDVIVAVKFCGPIMSLCRVGDSEWTEIDIPYEVPYESFEFSNVIYSERDKRFYLNNDDPDCTDQIDFTPKSGLVIPPVIGYPFPISNVPEEYEKHLYCRPDSSHGGSQDQLVESPSGQLFLVSLSYHWIYKGGKMENDKFTHMIVVYKQDEEEKGEYKMTKDIGDLCIFIGENEAFCVSASEYPGFKPNSVYFACHISGVGIWDLSSQTTLYLRKGFQGQPLPTMCWIPPTTTPILTS